jgi:hypothetical protein
MPRRKGDPNAVDWRQRPRRPRVRRDKPLTDAERAVVVAALSNGANRASAVRRSGTDYRRFVATLRTDTDFADAVILAENSCPGRCQELLYEAAMTNKDLSAAVQFIRLREAKANARFEKKIKKERWDLEQQVIRADIARSGTPAAPVTADGRPDFSILSRAECDDYAALRDAYLDRTLPSDPAASARFVGYLIRLQQAATAAAAGRALEGPGGA